MQVASAPASSPSGSTLQEKLPEPVVIDEPLRNSVKEWFDKQSAGELSRFTHAEIRRELEEALNLPSNELDKSARDIQLWIAEFQRVRHCMYCMCTVCICTYCFCVQEAMSKPKQMEKGKQAVEEKVMCVCCMCTVHIIDV